MTLIQCCDRPAWQGRSRRFETNPSRPNSHALRNRSGPISLCSKSLTKMPSGRRASSRARLVLRSTGLDPANRRRPSPTHRRRRAELLHCACRNGGRRNPNIRQAPNDRLAIDDEMLWRFFSAASTIQGKRFVQSYPPRVISRTRSPLCSTRRRYPSNLIS